MNPKQTAQSLIEHNLSFVKNWDSSNDCEESITNRIKESKNISLSVVEEMKDLLCELETDLPDKVFREKMSYYNEVKQEINNYISFGEVQEKFFNSFRYTIDKIVDNLILDLSVDVNEKYANLIESLEYNFKIYKNYLEEN